MRPVLTTGTFGSYSPSGAAIVGDRGVRVNPLTIRQMNAPHAATLPEIIQEMLLARHSERQGRLIDHDAAGSMEEKKRQGYF